MVADLEALVMVETPSEELARLRVGVELLAKLIRQRTGTIPTVLDEGAAPTCCFTQPGPAASCFSVISIRCGPQERRHGGRSRSRAQRGRCPQDGP